LSEAKKTLKGIGLNSISREVFLADQPLLFLEISDKILKMLKNGMKPGRRKAGD
jgi:ribosomal protein L30/L7E